MESSKKNLDWLEYDSLKQYPHVIQGTFGRNQGVLGVGPAAILANRELLRKELEVSKVIFPHQSHGAAVVRITAKNQDVMPHADALYTTEKNIGLGVAHADCQATIFYDPVHEAVGIVHCGWKGNVHNIYARLIESMQRELGTKPHQLLVCISPSLGPCCSEFVNYKQEFPKEFWEFTVQGKPNHFNLLTISKSQLTKCGVLDKNIELASDRVTGKHPGHICTCCNPDYFSYRREKEVTDRNSTIVALKN